MIGVVTACLLAAPMVWSQGDKDKQEPKKEQPPDKLTIAWHGQSFFSVKSSKGTLFVFDPHNITEYGPVAPMRPDVIMMSHHHNDHTQVGIFPNSNEKGDKAPKIIDGLIRGESGRDTWNIVDLQVKDLHIKSVGAFHDEVKGLKHGLITMFVVEVDGWRICHLGDLGHELSAKQLKDLGPLDVIMVPCGGIYGLNGTDAQRVVDQIKPKQYIFPMHIGTTHYGDLLPVYEFIDDSPYPCAIVRDGVLMYSQKARNNVAWLKENGRDADNKLVLEKHEQKKAVIVNLHYWPRATKKKT